MLVLATAFYGELAGSLQSLRSLAVAFHPSTCFLQSFPGSKVDWLRSCASEWSALKRLAPKGFTKQLRHLEVSSDSDTTPVDLNNPGLVNLTSMAIKIRGVFSLQYLEAMRGLVSRNPGLEKLSLVRGIVPSPEVLPSVAIFGPSLRSLKLHTICEGEIAPFIPRGETAPPIPLESLQIGSTQDPTDADLEAIASLPNLKHLELSLIIGFQFSPDVYEHFEKWLPKMPSLNRLTLSGQVVPCNWTDFVLDLTDGRVEVFAAGEESEDEDLDEGEGSEDGSDDDSSGKGRWDSEIEEERQMQSLLALIGDR
jgi:hypothetical protein